MSTDLLQHPRYANLQAAKHLLFDLLGPRIPYVIVNPDAPSAFEYQPFQRLLTLRDASAKTLLDSAAYVYLAHSHDLRGPYWQVPEHLQSTYTAIRSNLERHLGAIRVAAVEVCSPSMHDR